MNTGIMQEKKLWIHPSCSAKDATVQFTSMVKNMWREESLAVCNFPLYSDFNLNVLYTFGHLFEKVGLMHPSSTCTTFLFYKFRRWELTYERIVTEIGRRMVDSETLLDLRLTLREDEKNLHGSMFYSFCLYMNCIHIRKQILDIIQNIEQPQRIVAEKAVQDHDRNQSLGLCCSDCDLKRCLKKPTDDVRRESFSDKLDDHWLTFTEPCPHLELVKKSGRCVPFSDVEVTKFCSKELLSDWQLLCQKMRSSLKLTDKCLRQGTCLAHGSDAICASPKKYSWSTSELQVKRLDFGMELWMNVEHHMKHQSQSLQLIKGVLENAREGECLEIRGLPSLSEFSVSLIYVVAHMFEKVRFYHTSVGRNVIFFFNFRSFPIYLKQEFQESINDIKHVKSLVPLKKIFCGEFYQKMTNYNNSSLVKQCLYVTQFLSEHQR
ncbi:uncharacterized protein LOC117641263 isoform X2 [Thrips palmi]|uniref:Uncharacterized protein LOC117641263 isoform X2 n=1 Tax=Thrips palmi TaxID=161013 RepID=A0A6P8YBY1_THRPL|nr:uncharacterized protein LOC117641263 isoform X2 [Thrips palmi]